MGKRGPISGKPGTTGLSLVVNLKPPVVPPDPPPGLLDQTLDAWVAYWEADHTVISNAAINDARLSFRARGVLVWLLAKPDDWTTSAEALASQATEGRDAVRSAMRELANAGYIIRDKPAQAMNDRLGAVAELDPTDGTKNWLIVVLHVD